jgi:polyhydroxyalkanoate synthesis regulator phasin
MSGGQMRGLILTAQKLPVATGWTTMVSTEVVKMVELDKEQEKAFVDELMESNELKGATKKRLIKFLGNKYNGTSKRSGSG